MEQNVILLVTLVLSALYWNLKVVSALMLINFGAFFSPVYYAFLISNGDIQLVTLFGFIFESLVLVLSLSLTNRMLIEYDSCSFQYNRGSTTLLIVSKLFILFVLVRSGSWGVFAEGIRTGFTTSSWYLKYLVYGSWFLDLGSILVLARLLRNSGKFGLKGYVLIITIITSGILSGSKGSFVFLLLLLFLLVGKSALKIRTLRFMIVGASFGLPLFFDFLSQRLKLSSSQLTELLIKRFYLNNDTRALALDFHGKVSGTSFFSESFRSLASLIGMPPKLPPIGVFLYQKELSIAGGEGGNASFMALLTIFAPTHLSMFFWYAVVILLMSAIFLFFISNRIVRDGMLPFFRIIGVLMLGFVSQDFLAYQLFIRVAVLLIVFYLFSRYFERVISNNTNPKY